MNIIPVSTNHIKVETDEGVFNVYGLVGGGLEIDSHEGKTVMVECMSPSVIGVRTVVIKEER